MNDLSGLNFLVTGGAGFIGSNIAAYLLKHGARKVRILDNFATSEKKNIAQFESYPAFELQYGDIRNLQDCQTAVNGIDYVSHQAALCSVPRSVNEPLFTNDVNVGGFLNMLLAARDEGVKGMAYASSSSIYGDFKSIPLIEEQIGHPLSPYAVSKHTNELYAHVFSKLFGFHTTGLRYFNVFGPGQSAKGPYAAVIPLFFQSLIEKKEPVIYGDGEQSRDFTFIENAVQANIKAMLKENLTEGAVINIATGTAVSINLLWQIIMDISGERGVPVYKEARQGDVRHSLADIRKAKELIGYDPLFDIHRGLEITYDWYKEAQVSKGLTI